MVSSYSFINIALLLLSHRLSQEQCADPLCTISRLVDHFSSKIQCRYTCKENEISANKYVAQDAVHLTWGYSVCDSVETKPSPTPACYEYCTIEAHANAHSSGDCVGKKYIILKESCSFYCETGYIAEAHTSSDAPQLGAIKCDIAGSILKQKCVVFNGCPIAIDDPDSFKSLCDQNRVLALEERCSYTCIAGYAPQSSLSEHSLETVGNAECTTAGNVLPPIRCTRVCKAGSSVGEYISNKCGERFYTERQVCTFECEEGFLPDHIHKSAVGETTVVHTVCGESGGSLVFNKTPRCVKACKIPPSVGALGFEENKCSNSYIAMGNTCEYSCGEGYYAAANKRSSTENPRAGSCECSEKEHGEPVLDLVPSCEPYCRRADKKRTAEHSKDIDCTGDTLVRRGGSCKYTCDGGYAPRQNVLKGDFGTIEGTITCVEEKGALKFDGEVDCVEVCSFVAGSKMANSVEDGCHGKQLIEGESCLYLCDKGFRPVNAEALSYRGEFVCRPLSEDRYPKCVKDCVIPGDSGIVGGTDSGEPRVVLDGQSVRYGCAHFYNAYNKSGLLASGRTQKSTCVQGKWVGEIECKRNVLALLLLVGFLALIVLSIVFVSGLVIKSRRSRNVPVGEEDSWDRGNADMPLDE